MNGILKVILHLSSCRTQKDTDHTQRAALATLLQLLNFIPDIVSHKTQFYIFYCARHLMLWFFSSTSPAGANS